MKKISILFFLLICIVFGNCCAESDLTVLTYNSFSVSADLVAAFEAKTGIRLHFVQAGNGGEIVARSVLTKDAPIADVIIGFDNSQLEKVISNDILESYASPLIEKIPGQYLLDKSYRALPFNFGDVCINYDTEWFRQSGLPLPQRLEDLTDPRYHGLLAVQDPSSSNTGAAFLLATIAEYGEDGFVDYWLRLLQNGTEITNDWTTAYYTNFSASSGLGPQPMVVSYTTSPAAEMLYAETALETPPAASLTADGMCYRSLEFCGILKNCSNPEGARIFIDTFLGSEWQEDLPLQMFVYPVNQEAEIPEVFAKYGAPAEHPAEIELASVLENRNTWVQNWIDQVLSQY